MRWHSLIFAAASAVFIGYCLFFFNYVEDDAFIPMRYGLNFVHGYGWVMNPGGEHVEGYTSPLYLWYLTLLLRLFNADATIFISKFVGIVVGIAVLYQTRSFARLVLPRATWPADVAVVLLATRPYFALAMINGMETGFATLFLTAGLVCFLRDQQENHSLHSREGSQVRLAVFHPATALLFLLAALCRPELTLAFPVLLLLRRRRVHDFGVLLWYILPLAAFLLLRFAFYHDLLPNTYYAKRAALSVTIPTGMSYLLRFAFIGPGSLKFMLFAIGAFAMAAYGTFLREVSAVLALQIIFILGCGGDWMEEGRFFTVVVPLCAVIVAAGGIWIYRLDHWMAKHGGISRVEAAVGASVCLFLFVWLDTIPTTAQIMADRPYITGIREVIRPHAFLTRWMSGSTDGRYKMGTWIAEHARPGQYVASCEMGLPTLLNPRINFIDLRGLTDKTVARMQSYPHGIYGVQPHDWMNPQGEAYRYLVKRKPEWIVMLDMDDGPHADDIGLYVPTDTFDIAALNGDYWPVRTWRRRDVPTPSEDRPSSPLQASMRDSR